MCLSAAFHSTLARRDDFAEAPDAAASAASPCLLFICSAVSSGPHEPDDNHYSEPATQWRPLLNVQPLWSESMRRGVQEKAQVFVLQLQAVQRHLPVERQVQQQRRRQPGVRRGDDVQRLFVLARRESIDSSSLLLVCGEARRPSVLIFTAVSCCCCFVFVSVVADKDDFLVCLGVSFCLLACLLVCFSHIGLCDVYSSSFGTNASEGNELSFAPHRRC